MRALIDATALGTGRGGDETMLSGILSGLGVAAGRNDSFTVLCHDPEIVEPRFDYHSFRFEKMARRPGPAHFGVDLPIYLRRYASRFDAVLTITHAPAFSPIPVAHMVQDLSFLHLPDAYPLSTKLRLRALIGFQVKRAQAVMTLSEFCRRDLIASYGLDPSIVHVVPCTVHEQQPLPEERRERAGRWLEEHGVSTPFLLYLGNLHPRKNVVRTVRAFCDARNAFSALDEMRLVIAGARWWGSGEEAEAASADPGSVIFLGHVDDDVRQVLLDTAHALVYLSLFEGFGLPPLEAMAASTPVLASDTTAIPEITGGAGLLVDPLNLSLITEAIGRIATDDGLRKELVELGKNRVAEFSADRTGAATLKALAAAAGESRFL